MSSENILLHQNFAAVVVSGRGQTGGAREWIFRIEMHRFEFQQHAGDEAGDVLLRQDVAGIMKYLLLIVNAGQVQVIRSNT